MTEKKLLIAMLFQAFVHFFFSYLAFPVSANNVATEHVTYVQGPVSKPSYFGYSLAAQQNSENLTLWVGSPKYSAYSSNSKTESPTKQGAIYRCVKSLHQTNSSEDFKCSMIDLKAGQKGEKQRKLQNHLPPFALEPCNFQKDYYCGYSFPTQPNVNWKITDSSGLMNKVNGKGICFPAKWQKSHNRVTGPPAYTTKGFYLNAEFPWKTKRVKKLKKIIVSPSIRTKKGLDQCLRFCYHAYSIFPTAKRSLKVLIEYQDPEGNPIGKKNDIWSINEKTKGLSLYWNHTEIKMKGKHDGHYKIQFKATVYHHKHHYPRCQHVADIALADISVSNSHCEEEAADVNEIAAEQSIGLNLESHIGKDQILTMASCAPLWQQNCGYAREANGVCYEMDVSNGGIQAIRKHNPNFRECIRGKIDIVLLVDQSGSVNHCNFQKVKRWLRNIVRGFNIGEEEQDIGIVVYSSEKSTYVAIPLGFKGHFKSAAHKKEDIVETLKDISYEAGKTFTGYALKKANEMIAASRQDAKKIVILLTDGETTEANKEELKEQIAVSRKRHTTILAVGVGGFNNSELVDIAGNKKNVFSVKSFSELEKIRDKLKSSVSLGALEGGTKHSNQSSGSMQQCQTGFSVHFTKDGLLMGSPGCYKLSGNVISYHSSSEVASPGNELDVTYNSEGFTNATGETTILPTTDITDDYNISTTFYSGNVDYNSESYKDYAKEEEKYVPVRGKYEVPTMKELQDALSPNLSNSYLGYAVTSGFFFGPHKNEYVASSAPRFKGYGAVLFYHSLTSSPSPGRHFVTGQQFGEYFGATLCAEDMNGDEYTDLIVGGPLHSSLQPDEGRAYVYLGGNTMKQTPDFVLEGSNKAFSRFGSYITAVGDLNRDGYSDLAISAPLERNGVVFIFHGSKSGVRTKYVQKLDPLTFNPQPAVPPKKFGQFVLGKIDVDSNSYPDLIISSPGSDGLTILLSRPVINVDAELRSASEIDARSDACRNRSTTDSRCFECEVCFKYNSSIPLPSNIDYELKVDIAQDLPRFEVAKSTTNNIMAQIRLSRPSQFECNKHFFTLKKNVRDFMNPVVLNLNFRLNDKQHPDISNETVTPAPLSELSPSGFDSQKNSSYFLNAQETISKIESNDTKTGKLVPILNIYSKTNITKYVQFITSCRNPSKCISDLALNANVVTESGKKVSTIDVDSEQLLRLRVQVTNQGPEDGHNAAVMIGFSKLLMIESTKQIPSQVWTKP